MGLFYCLLTLDLCQSAILRSDLQMDISSQIPTPRDLLKFGLVDKNWISVEKVFNRITPDAGLFENKQTNEIIFETKEKSWHQVKIAEKWDNFPDPYFRIPQTLFKGKNWNKLFWIIIRTAEWWRKAPEFLKALAEIVDVSDGQVTRFKGTAIHAATSFYDNTIMKILLQRSGTDIHFKDDFGQTALHEAAYRNNKGIEILLKYGAKIDEPDKRLMTPLAMAVRSENYASVKTLLRHGADPNLKDQDGKTALQTAARLYKETTLQRVLNSCYSYIIEMLVDHGAEIDTNDIGLKNLLQFMGVTIKRKRNQKSKNKNVDF